MSGSADPRAGAARPAPLLEGRRVLGPAGRTLAGECTYTVIEPPRPAPSGDKRIRPRRRTRLRTGKVLDGKGRFLTECLIYDRSETGGRLRLPAGIVLTPTVLLYEDQSATLCQAAIVWRMARDVGLRIRPCTPDARTRALAAEMRRRFYAVPNSPSP